MKKAKLKQFIKRLPNDALYDLHEVLIEEINEHKAKGSRIKLEVKELERC